MVSKDIAKVTATVEQTQKKRAARYSASVKEDCKALYITGVEPAKIQLSTGVQADTVSSWATRGGWRALKIKVESRVQNVIGAAVKEHTEHESTELRAILAKELVKQGKKLEGQDFTASALASRDGKQGRATVAKTIAETASVVFGWGKDSAGVNVSVTLLEHQPAPAMLQDATATDVQAEVTVATEGA